MNSSPLLSVIVPVYNSEKTISQTIEAILRQSYPHVELIVVDDGSTDTTASIVKSFPKVNYLYQDNAGPATARNRGAFAARGEIIFFTDSDCVPRNDWLEKVWPYFSDFKIAVVSGSYDIANPEFILARCIHKEIVYRHHILMPETPKSFGSFNFAVRKNIFVAVGGFNASYRFASGEDNDLSYKILKEGYLIRFAKDSLVKHFHTTQLVKYLKEQYRHGFWRVKMYAEHPEMAKGDDYTFWKDMVEVPLVVAVVAGLVWAAFVPVRGISFCLGAVSLLGLMEVVYGYVMMQGGKEAVYYTGVTFLRAFARTFGFCSGFFYFLNLKLFKKHK